MKKLLWVGDACVASGFARATHKTLETLKESWDVFVLGLNYRGDPHQYPYPVYPAWIYRDPFGTNRIVQLARDTQADVIVIQNDPWNFPQYLEALKEAGVTTPVVGIVAVDGWNCQGSALNGLDAAIFWTNFGRDQAIAGGYTGPSFVVPLGVDLKMYRPMQKHLLRKRIEPLPGAQVKAITPDSYIVLNVNRNQLRKRLDLTTQYFCEWVREFDVKDAYLMLHACPTGEEEYDLDALMRFYGLRDRLCLITPEIGNGIPEAFMSATYNLADVQVSTSIGEGFGLTTFEGMACGIPQIVPDHSALAELGSNALKVQYTSFMANKKGINTIGGVADRGQFINALELAYSDPSVRKTLSERGLKFVSQPQYRWENIGKAVGEVLDGAIQNHGRQGDAVQVDSHLSAIA